MFKIWIAIGIVFFASSQSSIAAQWPNFRADAQNTGRVSFNTIDPATKDQNLSIRKYQTSGLIWSTAAIDDNGDVFVGSADKFLYAFNNQGDLKWKYKIFDEADALIDSGALITEEGLIIIPGGDGYLHAVDKKDGTKVWVFKADGADSDLHSSGVVVNSFEGNVTRGPNGLIYAGSDNGYMYAVTIEGQLAWKFKTNMMIWSSPAFDPDGKWMAFGSLDKRFYLLNPDTGVLLDKVNIKAEIKASPLVRTIDGQNYLYFGDANGKLYKYLVKTKNTDQLKLKKVWRYKTKKEIYSSATYFNDKILVGSRNGKFYAIDNETGKLSWVYDTQSVLASSPIITQDGVVIFGARNGKIYALDAYTGSRVWSLKTTDKNLKVNLDASPVMDKNGVIFNGSYSGLFYRIPYHYCLQNQEDSRCEFGGNKDLLPAIEKLADGVYFFYEDREGKLHQSIPGEVAPYETLRLRLIVKEKGQYIPNAALWPGLRILTEEGVSLKGVISSDSYYLNIKPNSFFPANKKIKLTIRGRYYKRTNWFIDFFKFFVRKRYQSVVDFQTSKQDSTESQVIEQWAEQDWSLGIRNMFLFQPISMETYIPAALDGQYFVIKNLGTIENSDRFTTLVMPAQKIGKYYEVKAWPNKVFLLNGKKSGNAFDLKGAFSLAAMGGSIPFTDSSFTGLLDEEKAVQKGQLLTIAPCLKIKGNGDSFQFPLSVIDDTCDYKMRLIAVGKYFSDWIKPEQSTEKSLNEVESSVTGDHIQINNGEDREILVVKITLNEKKEVLKDQMQVLKVPANSGLKLPISREAFNAGLEVIYIDGERL